MTDYSKLPAELRRSTRWLVWRLQDSNGRLRCKVPFDAKNHSRMASSTDPDTWSDFDTAVNHPIAPDQQYATEVNNSGIGLVIAEPYIAVDIDKVRDTVTGVVDEWALELLRGLNSYTEYSPSGRGFHIWLRGRPLEGKDGVRTDDLEVYCKKRYFTVTGEHVEGTPLEVRNLDTSEVSKLFTVVETRRAHEKKSATKTQKTTEGSTVNNKKYQLLKEGKIEEAGFEDVSAAVQSFLTYSAYYNLLETPKIDADFRASALHRDWRPLGRTSDWCEKWARLGPSEIAKAIETAKGWIERDRTKAKKKLQPVGAIGGFFLTDLGNGERLVASHGADFRYVHDWREWRTWDGVRWSIDGTAEIYRRAKDTIRGMMKLLAELDDEDEVKALKAWSFTCEAKHKVDAMVQQAARELGVSSRSSDFDQNPWLFNCPNGTLDLETITFRAPDKQDLCTKSSPVKYDPDAKPDLWVKFLERIIPDAEVRDFLQVSLGYSLSGHSWEKFVWFLIGETGDNGKTTFIETVRHIFGEQEGYAANMNFNSLMPRENAGAASGDIARLRGARFVSASESEQHQKLSGALLKRLTGGGDKITARQLYKEEFEFVPTHKLWLATNHAPNLTVDDDALWRRIIRVPFDIRIPLEERDNQLGIKLRGEGAPGILNWCLDGWRRYRAEGLKVPNSVRAAIDQYRHDLDDVREFLDECLDASEAGDMATSRLYEVYKSWFARTHSRKQSPMSQMSFSTRLKKRGYKIDHTREGRVVRSIGVLRGQAQMEDQEPPF
jgi:putative DNA primase/helicase